MTLGEFMRLTHPDMRFPDPKLKIFPRRGVIFECGLKDFDRWGPLADREVTGIWAQAWNELIIFVDPPEEKDEDPQIPGQMEISDYGIMGG